MGLGICVDDDTTDADEEKRLIVRIVVEEGRTVESRAPVLQRGFEAGFIKFPAAKVSC